MATKSRVTLRAQWLGKMLRELREENGLTLVDAAEYIRRSNSTLSRFEAGTWPITQAEVTALMKLYGVDSPSQRAQMLQLAEEITETGWWERYYKDITDTIDYVWLEDRAERLRCFTPLVVHGLLQTPEYAERLIRISDPDASVRQIERWTGIRMARQEILTREPGTSFHLVLDEAALRRPIGGAQVMRNQLRRLIVEAKKPNIEIHVLPFSAGEYPGTDGSFALVKLPDPFPEVVYIESSAGTIFLESTDVSRFATQYDRMQKSCLDVEQSVALIAAIEKDLA